MRRLGWLSTYIDVFLFCPTSPTSGVRRNPSHRSYYSLNSDKLETVAKISTLAGTPATITDTSTAALLFAGALVHEA